MSKIIHYHHYYKIIRCYPQRQKKMIKFTYGQQSTALLCYVMSTKMKEMNMSEIQRQLMMKIDRGEKLSIEEDELACALFPPDVYTKIPSHLKPDLNHATAVDESDDAVRAAFEACSVLFEMPPPTDPATSVQWMIAQQAIERAIQAYRPDGLSLAMDQIIAIAQNVLTGGDAPSGTGGGSPIRCTTDGREYPSVAAAARAYGLRGSQISSHISGRYGYKTVRGLTFEKIIPAP